MTGDAISLLLFSMAAVLAVLQLVVFVRRDFGWQRAVVSIGFQALMLTQMLVVHPPSEYWIWLQVMSGALFGLTVGMHLPKAKTVTRSQAEP
jgi:glucose-6-phosphate-specific signal transduction histidine kinase